MARMGKIETREMEIETVLFMVTCRLWGGTRGRDAGAVSRYPELEPPRQAGGL
jgi:hypothetical protein